ncbi:MAG: phosphomannomutase/phosphoglucomutase [Firmicutes bacterium]|nr:phosphomannomutase/phosphoglucomutase [Bacillota bacterium]
METLNYKKLQNGSDIRGVALPGVEGENLNLTVEAAKRLTLGFIKWLSEKTEKAAKDLTISIGHDPRLSGEDLKYAAISAMLSEEVLALDCGLASTPAMFMSTVFEEYKCDGAIMITASHLPFNRNGFKYFDKDGGLNKKDIAAIIEIAEKSELPGPAVCLSQECDLMETYASHLREIIKKGVNAENPAGCMAAVKDNVPTYERPLAGLKIVVDAGNGAGGFYAENILAPLGADVSGSQFLEPDGSFPNHAPNPEDKKAMASISAKVIETGADFGLIFDTDVDRSAAVDENGKEIARNGIVALAAVLASEGHPGTTVVTDSITSDQLAVFLEDTLGLKHLRFKRGYKNVINKAIELNEAGTDCQLAIETSGHAALKENYFLDDGAYLATKIVIKAALLAKEGKKISSVIADLEEPLEAREVRFPILAEEFGDYGKTVIEAFEKAAEAKEGIEVVKPNYEGVRLTFDKENGDGWCLLRMSLHDPIMPLNLESNIEGGVAVIAEKVREILAPFDKLDISKL